MRVQVQVDGYGFHIDTSDPELLARWLLELFGQVPFQPSTHCTVQVYPGWHPSENGSGPGRSDWVTDSRVIGRPAVVRSPAEFVEALQDQLRQAEALETAR